MDSNMFFHPSQERSRGRRHRIDEAKAVCEGCPVLVECRTHALTTFEPYGIWGGMSEEERAAKLGLRSLHYPAPIDPPISRSR